MDTFGRSVDYLRISVTDRCNERCVYCMPEDRSTYRCQPDTLTADQILRVVGIAAGLGFRKFRLTGGEPLLRPDVVEIVQRMAPLPGVRRIGLSTNATKLAALAQPLRDAGLRTVNISLDALDPQIYRRITGGNLDRVLEGVRAAVAAGFERVKLNCVLMRGVNESQIWPLVLFAAELDVPLRLIELMPITTKDMLTPDNFMPVEEARQQLRQKDELIPVPNHQLGWGPAKYYRLKHTNSLVGFIGAMTNPHFCETCNKMRLTADGKIRPCLGDHTEIDLRGALNELASDEGVRALLESALKIKPKEHQFTGQYQPCRPMTAIGG